MDPKQLMQLILALTQSQGKNIDRMKKPVGQIAESPKNRPRFDIMADEGYRPFVEKRGDSDFTPRGAVAPREVFNTIEADRPQVEEGPGWMERAGQGLVGLLRGVVGGGEQAPPRAIPVSQTTADAHTALQKVRDSGAIPEFRDMSDMLNARNESQFYEQNPMMALFDKGQGLQQEMPPDYNPQMLGQFPMNRPDQPIASVTQPPQPFDLGAILRQRMNTPYDQRMREGMITGADISNWFNNIGTGVQNTVKSTNKWAEDFRNR